MKIISMEIENLSPMDTIAIPHTGAYSGIAAAFEKLGVWAGQHNLWAKGPKMAGVYCDDPSTTPEAQLRSLACLEDLGGAEPGAGMQRYTIGGGKYFVTTVEVRMDEYGEAWQKAEAALNDKGYGRDGRDYFELYVSCVDHTQGADAPWIVKICLPVK